EHVPEHQCEHQRLECEHHLSFPHCCYEQRRHHVRRRQHLYHAEPDWCARRSDQFGDECGEFFGDTEWITRPAWIDHECLFPVWHDDRLRTHHPYAEPDWEHLPEY